MVMPTCSKGNQPCVGPQGPKTPKECVGVPERCMGPLCAGLLRSVWEFLRGVWGLCVQGLVGPVKEFGIFCRDSGQLRRSGQGDM